MFSCCFKLTLSVPCNQHATYHSDIDVSFNVFLFSARLLY